MTEIKKVRIAVVEDEIIIADHLCETLEELGYEVLEPAISYTEALDLLLTEKPDIAILDIRLSGSKDGIHVAEKINELLQIPFVFLTSNSDKNTLDRIKEVRPYAYLVKPFSKEELFISIEIAMSNHEQAVRAGKSIQTIEKEYVYVKLKNRYVKLNFESILFIKSDHIYIEIFTTKDKLVIRNSMNDFLNLLDNRFIRVHRSFAVNINMVNAFDGEALTILNHSIPISQNNRKEILEKLKI